MDSKLKWIQRWMKDLENQSKKWKEMNIILIFLLMKLMKALNPILLKTPNRN